MERSTVNRGALLRSAGLATLVLVLTPATTPGKAQEPIVFGVVGDTGEVTPGLRGVVREMLAYRRDRARFDFVLLLGDNIYRDGVGRGIQKVFEAPFADLLAADVQFYAVLGNHDIRRGTELQINYAAWNMAGRRFYAFSKAEGLVEFFALDSTALSDEARALVLVEKARLDNERAALQRKKTTLTASERRRLEKLNAELGEDVVFINEQAGGQKCAAGVAAGCPGEFPGAMEGGFPAPLDLLRRNTVRRPRRRTVSVETAASSRTHLRPGRRGPGPCRPRSSLRSLHAAARERAGESSGAVRHRRRQRALESQRRRPHERISG